MKLLSIDDVDINGKRCLIREDLNVPIRNGIITSDKRILAAIPTIKQALEQNAAVILLSHLGRPEEGRYDNAFSLKPVQQYLTEALDKPVRLEVNYLDGIDINPGEVVLCENVRFNVGEKDNDDELAKKLASLCDVFIMDAFGTAHRAQASTVGVAKYAKVKAAGPLLLNELDNLAKASKEAQHPIVAVVGGAKVSTKLALLDQLLSEVDTLILGGGIANTFLKAAGYNIGASLYEESLVDHAVELLEKAPEKLPLAKDVVVSKQCSETCPAHNKNLTDIADDDMILDLGPQTIASFCTKIEGAQTIIWNGPVGVFEYAPFSYGTRDIAFAIAESEAFSIAGGGDTLAAIDKYNLSKQISYISTGGGAFLEYLEGKTLPAVEALSQSDT